MDYKCEICNVIISGGRGLTLKQLKEIHVKSESHKLKIKQEKDKINNIIDKKKALAKTIFEK